MALTNVAHFHRSICSNHAHNQFEQPSPTLSLGHNHPSLPTFCIPSDAQFRTLTTTANGNLSTGVQILSNTELMASALVQTALVPTNVNVTTALTADPYRGIHSAFTTTLSTTNQSSWNADVPTQSFLLPTPIRAGDIEKNQQPNHGNQNAENQHNRDEPVDNEPCQAVLKTPPTGNPPLIIVVRLLMSGKEVGSIIGKRGENVKKYREESGAKINISDGSSPERIVTVTGTNEQIFLAFSLMCQKFEDDFTQGLLRIGDEGMTCPPVTLRLLVPANQCGSIIGKGGGRIKDVREMTGASIQVASEALPASTERTVTISGTAKAIAKCIRYLCDIFIESPVKGPVIVYRPRPAFSTPPIFCQNGPFSTPPPAGSSTQGLHPGLVMSTPSTTDSSSEKGFRTDGGRPNVSKEPSAITSQPLLGQNYVGPFSMCPDATSLMPRILGTSGSMDSGQAVNSGRSSAVLPEYLNDPMSVTNPLEYPNFSTCQWPLLSASHYGPGIIPGNVINPLPPAVVFPELSLNPALLYASPTLAGQNTNVLYSGVPNPLFRTVSIASSPTDVAFSQPLDNGLDAADVNQLLPSPLIPLIQVSNGYKQGSVYCGTPIPQNKASLMDVSTMGRMPASTLHIMNGVPLTGNVDDHVMKEMIISNDLIGCIIGRGGTTVNEIRSISKAQVKISNCEDGAKERKITLSGSLQSVNLAHFLINNRISAELFAGMMAFMNQ